MPLTGNVPQSEVAVGQRFGRGVVSRTDRHIGRSRAAGMTCDCGQEYVARLGHLRAGLVQSCGCLRRDRGRANPVMTASTHGLASHPLYPVWYKIMDRCTNPVNDRYRDYGGRGITVCERWHDVRAFIEDIEREIGPRPEGRRASGRPDWTLDRIDNNGPYATGNVRWATWHTQRVNRRPLR